MKDYLGYSPVYEANIALLQRYEVPYIIQHGYEELMKKYKQLRDTRIEVLSPTKVKNASSAAYWEGPTTEKPYSRVTMIDFTHDALVKSYSLFRQTRRPSLEIIACRTFGTTDVERALEVLDSHTDLFGLTLLGHELGHGREFDEVFLPQFPNDPVKAGELYASDYNEQLASLPLGMHTREAELMFQNQNKLTQYYEQNAVYFVHLGINSCEELCRQFPRLLVDNQIAYRNLRSERYADEIAAAAVQAVVSIY
jgi:hypothetical protein